jgi:hypothetical protein
MTIAIGTGRGAYRARGTVIGPGPAVMARRSRLARRRQRRVWLRIGLGILRSRPFHERVILAIIGAAAIARIARESQARALARLAAWDRQQSLRQRRKAGAD